jgi:malonyl-CoA O-methyltransferase
MRRSDRIFFTPADTDLTKASALDQARIAAYFDQAAMTYAQAATIQNQAAALFDAWLACQTEHPPHSMLELGSGTGFLSQRLQRRYPHTPFHVTDIAPGMLAQCQRSLQPSPYVTFGLADAATPSAHARLNHGEPWQPDWIISAMCFQWLPDLVPQTLLRHYAQCRVLAFSLMLDGSFSAWKQAHQELDISDGLHALPSADELQSFSLCGWRMHSQVNILHATYPDGLAFLHALRETGASQSRKGYAPINLRPILRRFADGFTADYKIGFYLLTAI